VDNITLKVFASAAEAGSSALLPYEKKTFHPDYRPDPEAREPRFLDVVEAFPQIRGYMKARIRRVKEGLEAAEKEAEKELRETLAEIERSDCDKELLRHVAKGTYRARLRRHEKELLRCERFVRKEAASGITQTDIERAREHPIREILEVQRRDGFVRCPFHDERTASLKVFKDNHWWCFGACQEGGDVIDLVMKMDGLTFVETVRKLSGKAL